jgi:hypothetical protein
MVRRGSIATKGFSGPLWITRDGIVVDEGKNRAVLLLPHNVTRLLVLSLSARTLNGADRIYRMDA